MALSIGTICVIGLHQTCMCFILSTKVTVCCGSHARSVIGPHFSSMNRVCYRAMLEDYFWPELDGLGIIDMWFQQDSATCHTAGQIIDLLNVKFGNRKYKYWQGCKEGHIETTMFKFQLWQMTSTKISRRKLLHQHRT